MLVIVGHELELDARYPALLDPAPLGRPAPLDPALLDDSSVGTRPASKEQGRRRCQFRGAARDAAAG